MKATELPLPMGATTGPGPSDPRARRTRTQLMAALVELATHKELDDITIAELTTTAGVNRATFYLHYSDKEGLLLDAIDALTDEVSTGAAAATVEELDDVDHAPLHTLAFFAELDQRASLYRRVLGPTGSPALIGRLHDGMRRVIVQEIHRRAPDLRADERSIERRAAFVAGGVIAAAVTWLSDDERVSAEEEAAAVWQMVLAAAVPLDD